MTESIRDQLISYFWDGLSSWDYDSWQSAAASDKEEIVAEAVAELGINVDIDEAYDLFCEWASGLEDSDFEE